MQTKTRVWLTRTMKIIFTTILYYNTKTFNASPWQRTEQNWIFCYKSASVSSGAYRTVGMISAKHLELSRYCTDFLDLTHDIATCSKFATKTRLNEIFFKISAPSCFLFVGILSTGALGFCSCYNFIFAFWTEARRSCTRVIIAVLTRYKQTRDSLRFSRWKSRDARHLA